MHFVDIHRVVIYRSRCAPLHPIAVAPGKAVQLVIFCSIVRSGFHVVAIRVAFHQLFSFRSFKHFSFSVYPAGSKPDRMGGNHHVVQHAAAVLDKSRDIAVGKYQQNRGSAVIRIAFYPHNFRVKGGQFGDRFRILNGDDLSRLITVAAGGISSGFNNGV